MMWPRSSEQELQAERIHYDIIRHLVPNNAFNAVKYLYDRLNILDAKAQGLLTRNGLLLTTVSIVASTQIGKTRPFLYHPDIQILFGIAFILLVASTFLTMSIMFITFDSITIIPDIAKMQLQAACSCNEPRPDSCQQPALCRYRTLLNEIQGLNVLDQSVRLSLHRSNRDITAYEATFFDITIRRQKLLRCAQYCTVWATILFFFVIGLIFWQAANQTLPAPGAA